MRLIDADELKKRLQENHDFFLMAWNNSTVNMPKEDKARCDEISNCIAEVINAPTVDLGEDGINIEKYSDRLYKFAYEKCKEDVIHSIAEQYSEHNELVPIWLSIGDIRGGKE